MAQTCYFAFGAGYVMALAALRAPSVKKNGVCTKKWGKVLRIGEKYGKKWHLGGKYKLAVINFFIAAQAF